MLRAELCPHPFTARTLKLPPQNAAPKLTVIVFVPAPDVIDVPVGKVHWYDVALFTAAVL
jgi:hypothetical protein